MQPPFIRFPCAGRDCSHGWIGILKFLAYIKEEILLVLAVSSSEPAMPSLMGKWKSWDVRKGL